MVLSAFQLCHLLIHVYSWNVCGLKDTMVYFVIIAYLVLFLAHTV